MGAEAFDALDAVILAEPAKMTFREAFGQELLGPEDGPAVGTGAWLSGGIFFSGDWAGLLRVDLPLDLAKEVAGTWLGADPRGLERGTVMDAVGELANTVAGLLKPALLGVQAMSVPRVAVLDRPTLVADRSKIVGATLRLDGRCLQVSLWKCPPQFRMQVVPKPDPANGASFRP